MVLGFVFRRAGSYGSWISKSSRRGSSASSTRSDSTAPSVIYKIVLTDKSEIEVTTRRTCRTVKITEIKELWIKVTFVTPDGYLGANSKKSARTCAASRSTSNSGSARCGL